MILIDLPEPKRRLITAEERTGRQWELAVAFLWLTALYATLHKGVVPLCLGFTRLANSPHAAWSPWFLHPLLLAFLASRDKRLSLTSSLLCGAGIANGIVESHLVVNGEIVGWLAFSHLLAAVPFAMVCVALLSGPFPGRDARAAWAGAILVLLFRLGGFPWA